MKRAIINVNDYTYKAMADESILFGTSQLLNANVFVGEETAHFRGALLTLFGNPLHQSENAEAAYDYVIEVSDRKGGKWVFTVYEGPSGPAVGYDMSKEAESAMAPATALIEKIKTTEPSDFEETVYYEDFDSTIIYGCKAQKCFYNEQ